MKIAIKTLGCKSNRADSDKLVERTLSEFKDGVSVIEVNYSKDCPDDLDVDVCLINTCIVTHVADRKSRSAGYHLKKIYPNAKIVVFGCGPKVDFKGYTNLKKVDFVSSDEKEIFEYLKKIYKESLKSNSNVLLKKNLANERLSKERTRAVIKVQDGCNNFCTYCIIPFARGRERSFPLKSVLDEAKKICKKGFKEIILTGINVGSWSEKGRNRKDKKGLANLIIKILNDTTIERLRLSSIEPQNFTENFKKLFTSPKYKNRFCPHMHMSLQSGCDSILKAMRRNYSTNLYKKVVRELKILAPDIALTTDVIVGFPGETESNFKETYEFVKEIGFAKVHVFPYSKRTGTVAALMDNQVPEEIKKERASELQKLSDKLRKEFFDKQIGRIYPVLFENKIRNEWKGFTANYIPVKLEAKRKAGIKTGSNLQNQILNVKLKKVVWPKDKEKAAYVSGLVV